MLKKAWESLKSAPPAGEGKLVIVKFKDGQKARAALTGAKFKVTESKGDWNTGRWYVRLDMSDKKAKELEKEIEKAKKTLDDAGIKIIHFQK